MSNGRGTVGFCFASLNLELGAKQGVLTALFLSFCDSLGTACCEKTGQ